VEVGITPFGLSASATPTTVCPTAPPR
jgi:hypothetical protein